YTVVGVVLNREDAFQTDSTPSYSLTLFIADCDTEVMSVNFLGIPQNAKACIFRCMDDKSLRLLREVCKESKAVVDLAFIRSRKTVVKCLYITNEKDINVGFRFANSWDY
ncbi:hypothetical protein PENTCL1PPCAC_9105, partial [Pristionchus entomophagus]